MITLNNYFLVGVFTKLWHMFMIIILYNCSKLIVKTT